MKAHGLLERVGAQHRYRLTDKGTRVRLIFTLFHKRVCGPLAGDRRNSGGFRLPHQRMEYFGEAFDA